MPHLLLSTVTLGESLPVKPQQKHNRIASTVQTFTGGQANNKLGYYIRAEIDCWWGGGKEKRFSIDETHAAAVAPPVSY